MWNYPLASYKAHEQEINDAILSVLNGGHYILGEQVSLFEQEFNAELGSANTETVSCACGTDALILSLLAAGIGRNNRVATVSMTASATPAAIVAIGAKPVFLDVDESYTINDKTLLTKVIDTVDAVMPVHLYGQPANGSGFMMLGFWKRFTQKETPVIQDCCQAAGAMVGGVSIGCLGNYAAYSFYPTKNLGAMGDGGAVICSKENADKIRQLRQYGWNDERVSINSGRCSRLDEVQAAILRVKLRHLKNENKRRREIANIYDGRLKNSGLILPLSTIGITHIYHQYIIRTPKCHELKKFMAGKGIPLQIHYPVPCHLQPAFVEYERVGYLVNTEKYCQEVVSLPMHQHLTDKEVNFVCDSVLEWCEL